MVNSPVLPSPNLATGLQVYLRSLSWPCPATATPGVLFWVAEARKSYAVLGPLESWKGFLGWPFDECTQYSLEHALHDVVYLTQEVSHHSRRMPKAAGFSVIDFMTCSRILHERATMMKARLREARSSSGLLEEPARAKLQHALAATEGSYKHGSIWWYIELHGELFLFYAMAQLLHSTSDLRKKLHEHAYSANGRAARFQVWNRLAELLQDWYSVQWQVYEVVEKDLSYLEEISRLINVPTTAKSEKCFSDMMNEDIFGRKIL